MDSSLHLTDADLELLNTPTGLKHLLASPDVDVGKALELARYDVQMQDLHVELIHLQKWVIRENQRVVIIIEGRDAAGKGGAIRQLTAHINPRNYRTYALPKPTDDEKGQWYFQRYVNCLPNPGEMAFFDRSWYNRAVVEPVNDFCTEDEYQRFMEQVNDFEQMLVASNAHLIKFYFSISKEEQARRFETVRESSLKKWQMTSVDERAQQLWDKYTTYEEKMLSHTNTDHARWVVIDANDNTAANLTALRHVLETIPYERDETTSSGEIDEISKGS